MSETRHTPTPWETSYRERSNGSYGQDIYDSNGATIATCEWYSVPTPTGFVTNRTANAEFIVRAVNSHQALVEALRHAINIIDLHVGRDALGIVGDDDSSYPLLDEYLHTMRAALQHAEAR
jgi:hypothetical protein